MAEQDELARIRAYLAEHQTTYDRAALRRKLIDDGYSSQTVDQALAELDGPQGQTGLRVSPVILTLLTIVGVVLLNGTICIAGLRSIGLSPILILLVVEIVAIVALWRGRAELARGVLWGLLLWGVGTLALIVLLASQL